MLHSRYLMQFLASLSGLCLCACAQVQVSSQSADPGMRTYELKGATLSHLRLEADKLCPYGVDMLRQAETDVLQPGAYRAVQWWNNALSWLEDERREAQLLISCKRAPPTSAVTPTPNP